MAGVFVAGDVRKGSVKLLASAVGAGAMVIQYVHRFCAHTMRRRTEEAVASPSPSSLRNQQPGPEVGDPIG
jgi:hypothetical protein